ncbi:MAG: CAP domain-containing protein [Bacteroidota bacterium]|nr:CAP domain-containing protein [Bacteroidota bacterium]
MKTNFLFSYFISLTILSSLASFSPPPAAGIADDVLKYTNNFRKSKGLTTLIMRDDLNSLAQKHSEDMARGRVGFGHSGFNRRYNEASKMIKGFKNFGENVAYGARSGKEAVTMWENSTGHRRNLLGNYRYIGIGTAKDRHGIIYYTQVFAN